MDFLKPWAFLIYCLRAVYCFHTVLYEYHFMNTAKPWPDAQQYCRLHYDDLATFTSMEDIQRMQRPSSYFFAWIGLADDPASWKGAMTNDSNSWRWSATGTSLGGYQAWEQNEPNFYPTDNTCVFMRRGLWADYRCTYATYFVCFTGSLRPGAKQFIMIKSYETWTYALDYCRTHYVDLAVIEDASDLAAVSSVIGPYHWAWIGLSREPFRWSDGRTSHFRNWMSGEPDNKHTAEHCVVENSDAEHHWLDGQCSLQVFPFICQQALKSRTHVVRMELQTAADLTNTVISAQLKEKVNAVLTNLGLTDIKLSWKMLPEKPKKEEHQQIVCPSNSGKL